MPRSRCAFSHESRRHGVTHPLGEALESRHVLSVAVAIEESVDIDSAILMGSPEPCDAELLSPAIRHDRKYRESADDAIRTAESCEPLAAPSFTIPIDDDVDPLPICPDLDAVFCLPSGDDGESSPPIESDPESDHPDLDDPRFIRRTLKGARDTDLSGDELWSLLGDELP